MGILNFKDNILNSLKGDIKIDNKEAAKKEMKEKVESLINDSFLKQVSYLQDSYNNLNTYLSNNIDNDLDHVHILEIDKYGNDIINIVETRLKEVTNSIIQSLPNTYKDDE